MQGLRCLGHRTLWQLANRHPVLPIWWTYGDESRVSANTALKLGKAHRHERTLLGYLIEVRDAFCLRVAVPEQPRLSLKVRSGVGVERFVAMARLESPA
jgi:hypothetical protein